MKWSFRINIGALCICVLIVFAIFTKRAGAYVVHTKEPQADCLVLFFGRLVAPVCQLSETAALQPTQGAKGGAS